MAGCGASLHHSGANNTNDSVGQAQAATAVSDVSNEKVLYSGTARITLAGDMREWSQVHSQIQPWVQTSLDAVTRYYGVFPVDRLHIAMTPTSGRSINGTVYPGEMPVIVLRLGRQANPEHLRKDWVLVHEISHLMLPSVNRRHHWLEEGMATYIEPLIRYQSGLVSRDEVWRWLIKGVPKGLPRAGDKGLDFTPTWGRTYWGGALFCLLADIEIQQQSQGRYNLGHALLAVRNAGGTMQTTGQQTRRWPIDRVLKIADQATQTNALQTLYKAHANNAIDVDLDALWQSLGVRLENDMVSYDDSAPLAAIRRNITDKSAITP